MFDAIDNLARDSIAAERAGQSYGKWKANHPNTRVFREKMLSIPQRPKVLCINCGKPIPDQNPRKKYCSEYCRSSVHNARYREKSKQLREEKRCKD